MKRLFLWMRNKIIGKRDHLMKPVVFWLHKLRGHMAVRVRHIYRVVCLDAAGNIKWTEEFGNIVVTAGLNKYLDATLKTGLASPAWYVGLKGTGSVVAGDTMTSHAGWSEIVPYSNANRPTWTPGAISAGSVDNSGAVAAFTINSGTTVYGCFLADNNTKSGSTGNLLGGGDFGASRAVLSGDTLNVTITCSLS